jgi:hypothetical protein
MTQILGHRKMAMRAPVIKDLATGCGWCELARTGPTFNRVAHSRKALEDQRTVLSETGFNSGQLSGISEVSDISEALS